jgi:type IV pilus assembly protein PilB
MDAINMGHVYSYITKPWEPEEIKVIVRGGIEAYEKIRVSREPPERRMIGQILIDYGMISEDQLDTALEVQRREKGHERRKLGEILVDLEYTDEESLFFCYALQLGIPYVSLSQFSSRPEFAELLPRELAYKHTIAVVDRIGQVLVVATSEPLSNTTKGEVETATGYKVMTVCALHRDIEAVLEKCYGENPPYP